MSLRVSASAPGKVILFGEHSVVYGKRCLATAIDLRTVVELIGGPEPDRGATLRLETLGDVLEDRIDSVKTHFDDINAPLSPLQCAFKVIAQLVLDCGSTEEFLTIRVRSGIPEMRGLGSSAAFSVASTAAILLYFGRIGAHPDKTELDMINAGAFSMEQTLHGRASGVDNTISCYGGLVSKKDAEVSRLPSLSLDLIVIDTGCARVTAKQVAEVRSRRDAFPTAMDHLLEAASDIAEEAVVMAQNGYLDQTRLASMIEMNQGILEAMGVGHEKISHVIEICRRNECPAVKITGAGGGGCLIAFPSKETNRFRLVEELDLQGYRHYQVKTGMEGVTASVDSARGGTS